MSKTKSTALILGVLAMSIFVGYLVLAWTEPTEAPPGGNVPAPLNTSINAQSKEGTLVIGTNSAVTTGLIVQYGNVGIGTTSPSQKLDVSGQIHATGDICTDAGGGVCLSTGGGGGLTNCAWTNYGTCGASGGGQVLCSSNRVVNGIDIIGCTSATCDDVSRCEKTRLYCCDLF